MSNAFTTNLNLTKPEVGADSNAWGGHLNADLDALDAVVTPNGTGTAVGINIAAAVTSTTYTLNMSGVMTGTGSVNMLNMSAVDVKGSTFGIHDATDTTKIVRISVAAITTGSTRTINMIDGDVTIVGTSNTQTLSAKTLNSPTINTATLSVATTGVSFLGTTTGTMSLLAAATATGTLLMPGGLTTDTIATVTASQTFLNKTISGAVNTITNVSLTAGVTGILPAANGGFPGTTTTNSLGSNVAINVINTDFTGPTVSQGTSGTWWAFGKITINNQQGGSSFIVRLWDGTTVIDSASFTSTSTAGGVPISLGGYIASPAGNIRITCQCSNATASNIAFNLSGYSKDSTLSAVRIA